jgi:DNA-binding transcriptional regulator YiaG
MTKDEYKAARERLGLTNVALAQALGIYIRTAQRYEAGDRNIPESIARLLRMYLRHGIPED